MLIFGRITPSRLNKKNSLIDQLVNKGFLVKEPKVKNFYTINRDYHRTIKNFISNNAVDSKLNSILQLIMEQ